MSKITANVGSSILIRWDLPTGDDDWSSNFHASGCTIVESDPSSDIIKFPPDTVENSNIGTAGYIEVRRTVDKPGEWRFYFEYYYDNGHGSIIHRCYKEITVRCKEIPDATAKIPREQIP